MITPYIPNDLLPFHWPYCSTNIYKTISVDFFSLKNHDHTWFVWQRDAMQLNS